jgi:isopenicillin N synthase-like dioxygenase
MKLGVENTAGVMDIREQVEYATEYAGDNTASGEKAWPAWRRLHGTNPWPNSFQPQLKPTVIEYALHACRIADWIREALCLALGLPKDGLNSLFEATKDEKPHWVLKLISYPPVQDTSKKSFGVGAHTDTNFLTLVLQDDVGGLQVFSKGEWIDVLPTSFSPNTGTVLVCNLGEQAEILSCGYFLATPHRVLPNTKSDKDRISVALFYNPKLSARICPIKSLPQDLKWEREKGYDEERHWRMKCNSMLSTVG